ncbi:MAG: single-stranded DNA-binding protein [Saprospiraceae bacterium]|nr:single-stranded DNA-binding protein [Saprospiraceae bacterium]
MRGLNKVMLIGNLGKDPELQTLEGGVSVVKFSLATTESYKDDAGVTHSHADSLVMLDKPEGIQPTPK